MILLNQVPVLLTIDTFKALKGGQSLQDSWPNHAQEPCCFRDWT